MKKWLIYLAGIVTGVIITLLFAYIFASKYSSDDTNLSEDDDFTYFDKPGEKLENDAFKVFQVIADSLAPVCCSVRIRISCAARSALHGLQRLHG